MKARQIVPFQTAPRVSFGENTNNFVADPLR